MHSINIFEGMVHAIKADLIKIVIVLSHKKQIHETSPAIHASPNLVRPDCSYVLSQLEIQPIEK